MYFQANGRHLSHPSMRESHLVGRVEKHTLQPSMRETCNKMLY